MVKLNRSHKYANFPPLPSQGSGRGNIEETHENRNECRNGTLSGLVYHSNLIICIIGNHMVNKISLCLVPVACMVYSHCVVPSFLKAAVQALSSSTQQSQLGEHIKMRLRWGTTVFAGKQSCGLIKRCHSLTIGSAYTFCKALLPEKLFVTSTHSCDTFYHS